MRTLVFKTAALACCLFPFLGIAAPHVDLWEVPEALKFANESSGKIVQGSDGQSALLIPEPEALPPESLRETLPRTGAKLLSKEPYTILAIGDSVTATGPFPEILSMLLGRATGNQAIQVRRAAYPGRSVDAAIRRWDSDAGPVKGDLALIMFGLNDQGAGAPVEAYLEQVRWLVDELHAQGADVVLLEPTPHINITRLPGVSGESPADAAIFRTIDFGGALHVLGRELNAPVARTFDALWGGGADDLQATARQMWPLFPKHYSQTFSSLTETGGKGDTIHPNALGHLKMAQAVLAALAGQNVPNTLTATGATRWSDGKLVTSVTIQNQSDRERVGRVDLYPVHEDDTRATTTYALAAGSSQTIDMIWPNVSRAEDLLVAPLSKVFAGPGPFVQMVDYHDGGSRVSAVRALMIPEVHWIRERTVVAGGTAVARFSVNGEVTEVQVPLSEGSDVGRVALNKSANSINAAAELAYVRAGVAKSGEVVADGNLDEWADARWMPVGEPVQARWTAGPADYRPTPETCYLHWAFKAGAEGVWVAFRGTGNFSKDRFTLYFDPREPRLLGTAGPYFWVSGAFKSDEKLSLQAGDSSPSSARGLTGALKRSEDGTEGQGEFFVPYETLNISSWPASGDLGVSIVWEHGGADGRSTRLMWSENGHPWNTLWFGFVRRDPVGPPPWIVHVN